MKKNMLEFLPMLLHHALHVPGTGHADWRGGFLLAELGV